VIIGSNDKYVQSRHSQLVPAQHLIEPKALERPDDDALALNAERTRKALEAKLHGKTAAAAPIAAAEAAARTHGGEVCVDAVVLIVVLIVRVFVSYSRVC